MKLIVIDGNIGSGKTTVIKQLKKHLKDVFILEENVNEWKQNGILDSYYENPDSMAFVFQMKVATSHLKNIRELVSKYGTDITIISERSTYTCFHIFTKMLEKSLSKYEIETHRELCLDVGLKPDKYIFLETSVETVIKRILERNRETNIDWDYLEKLNNKYKELEKICFDNGIIYEKVDANQGIKDVYDDVIHKIYK